MSLATRLPTYFLSHGGGPWPYLKGDTRLAFSALESSLQAIPRQLAAGRGRCWWSPATGKARSSR